MQPTLPTIKVSSFIFHLSHNFNFAAFKSQCRLTICFFLFFWFHDSPAVGIMCPWVSSDGATNSYCLNGAHATDPCCADPCKLVTQYNPANNELNYVQGLTYQLKNLVPDYTPHFLIDTGRNGKSDERSSCSNWCNIRGAGVGIFPTAQTAVPSMVDAYFYLKTPGER